MSIGLRNYNFVEPLIHLQDEIIVDRAKHGDRDAFNYILLKYKYFVKSKARSYFLIGGDKEDIIQEGMIGLFKAVRDFKIDKDSSFRSFAEMCITRQIITAIKSATRQKHMPLNSYISLYKSVYLYEEDTGIKLFDYLQERRVIDPEQVVIDTEQMGIIESEIMELLSEYEFDVFNSYIEGLTYKEISKTLGKQEKSVDNAIQRIKRKVEKYFGIKELDVKTV